MRNRMGSSLNLDTTVVGLQGHPISSIAPAGGQALVFDGTDWVPTTVQVTAPPPAVVGPTPPAGPGIGDLWFNNSTGVLNVWDGTAWVPTYIDNDPYLPLAGGTLTGPLVLAGDATSALNPVSLQQLDGAIAALPPSGATISDTAPANPTDGDLWWDTVSGQLFIWYVDANSSQWVVANVSVGVPGPAGPAGPNVMPPGVTDGSNAAAGQVGEILTATVPVSGSFIPSGGNGAPFFSEVNFILANALPLTNGDWQVYIDYNVTAPFSTPSATEVYASMQSGAFGNITGNVFRFFPGYQVPIGIGSSFTSAGISGNYTFPQVTITDSTPIKAVFAQFNNFIIGSTNVVLSGNAYFWARRMR